MGAISSYVLQLLMLKLMVLRAVSIVLDRVIKFWQQFLSLKNGY